MVIVGRLVAKFNTYYDKRPLLTTMVTNAVRSQRMTKRKADANESRFLEELQTQLLRQSLPTEHAQQCSLL